MHSDDWDARDDPWRGRVPWMRRPFVQRVLVAIAVGTFLVLTLVSTCTPRAPQIPGETTTTGVTL